MDCQRCYRQHLKSVNNYTVLGLGGKLAKTVNSLDIISTSLICGRKPLRYTPLYCAVIIAKLKLD